MSKKFCKMCGKKFRDNTNDFHCPSCKSFNDARCLKPQFDKLIPRDEIHFSFRASASTQFIEKADNGNLMGFHVSSEKNDYSIVWINLFNFTPSPTVHKEIAQTIMHEYIHKAIFDLGEFDAVKKYDVIAKRLENWLYEK